MATQVRQTMYRVIWRDNSVAVEEAMNDASSKGWNLVNFIQSSGFTALMSREVDVAPNPA